MSFEIRNRDIMGRIGRLSTKSGVLETPAFLPVVKPVSPLITPKRMMEDFKCRILIANAYLIRKEFGEEPRFKVHELLDYKGIVATDSGAYQILVYGDVEVDPDEIINFQQHLESDIAVILDIPTGWNVSRNRAEYTVEETIRRAREALSFIEDDKILWVGPIQGGGFFDLVARSAVEIGSMPFQIYALGSPTQVMENYHFSVLVDMIMSAKLNLPANKPFHLFGAGHPMIFSLAVALGCDMFDSAAYALYARKDRYMTSLGTMRLHKLTNLPCSCPVCRRHDATELKEMLKKERTKFLTEHNLYVSMTEIDTIRQAISEGGLWELLEARSRGHPALATALRHLIQYRDVLEKRSGSFKRRGLFIFDYYSLVRPEITRHIRKLSINYRSPREASKLLLLTAPKTRPYTRDPSYHLLRRKIKDTLTETMSDFHLCFYTAPFGVVPPDLSETYPLSQYEAATPFDYETLKFTVEQVGLYIEKNCYSEVVLYKGNTNLDDLVEERCRELRDRKRYVLTVVSEQDPWTEVSMLRLDQTLKNLK